MRSEIRNKADEILDIMKSEHGFIEAEVVVFIRYDDKKRTDFLRLQADLNQGMNTSRQISTTSNEDEDDDMFF